MTKILLFGASGMLGSYIVKHVTMFLVVPISFRVKYESLCTLENILLEHGLGPDTCVINCIGLIPQRASGKNTDYILVNSIFPHVLALICNKYNSNMIQPSTDCVFNGLRSGGMYTELDKPDESSMYGLSKAAGEPVTCTVIRCSIIGFEENNKNSFLEWVVNSSNPINGWSNHYWNGITCLQYCKVITQIISEKLFWKGVRHISSPSLKSKYELACLINEYLTDNKNNIMKIEAALDSNKTLSSVYNDITFNIPELEVQIKELNMV